MKTNAIGVIFTNIGDTLLRDMTTRRCMGSVPFGGRYRLIDFPLSAMVHAGISKVGITTRHNYRSLMDHLGSGKPWDLSRKTGGIYLFPPFSNLESGDNTTRLSELAAMIPFLENSTEDYVICSDCDAVYNFDMNDILNAHIESGADITFGYVHGVLPAPSGRRMVLNMDENQKVQEILIQPALTEECDYAVNVTVHNRKLLIQMVKDALSRNYTTITRDVYQRQVANYNMRGYAIGGYVRVIDSVVTYLRASQDLLKDEVRESLFCPDRPILTKERDDAPTRYAIGSKVTGSVVADGCVIEGEVTNCVLFRGVKVEKGTVLSNCVIMQDSVISKDSKLSYVITDKKVEITPTRTLMGFESYPAYIGKNSIV